MSRTSPTSDTYVRDLGLTPESVLWTPYMKWKD